MASASRDRFKNSRNRLDRATHHAKAFTAEWDAILHDESCIPVFIKNPNTGWYDVLVHLSPDSAERIERNTISLELGEFAYQLRAALDGLIWEAITRTQGAEPPSDAKYLSRLEFPLAPTWKANDVDAGRFYGFPFPQNLIDWMKTIQPDATEKPIGALIVGLSLRSKTSTTSHGLTVIGGLDSLPQSP
jgi:hypothetical protein